MLKGIWSVTTDFGIWSTKPVNGANGMLKSFGLYPCEKVSKERYDEMKDFCTRTFGPMGGVWDSSYLSHSFGFRHENHRTVFLVAFYKSKYIP